MCAYVHVCVTNTVDEHISNFTASSPSYVVLFTPLTTTLCILSYTSNLCTSPYTCTFNPLFRTFGVIGLVFPCLCDLSSSLGRHCRFQRVRGEVIETLGAAVLPKNQLDSKVSGGRDLQLSRVRLSPTSTWTPPYVCWMAHFHQNMLGDHISTILAGNCMVAKVIKYTARAQCTLGAL